ncbi:hypothetical protein KCU61_g170, partial [Aureobasidium melanogenum]
LYKPCPSSSAPTATKQIAPSNLARLCCPSTDSTSPHASSQTPLPIHVQPRHATVAYLLNGELFQSTLYRRPFQHPGQRLHRRCRRHGPEGLPLLYLRGRRYERGGGFEVSTSPPPSPRTTPANRASSSPQRPGIKARSRSGGAAYTITEECERLFCKTLDTVFLGEGNTVAQDSLVMGMRYNNKTSIDKSAPLPSPSPSTDSAIDMAVPNNAVREWHPFQRPHVPSRVGRRPQRLDSRPWLVTSGSSSTWKSEEVTWPFD